MPIGGLHKDEVRRLAHAAGLAVFDKPDSTGICFIGERPFQEFLSRYLRTAPGPIENADGEVVGEHRGLALYTLGQRSGLRVGGRAGAAAAPWYVAAKDTRRNTLVVVQHPGHPLLMSDSFDVDQVNWLCAPQTLSPDLDSDRFACGVKTRYRQADLPCRVRLGSDGRVRVWLLGPARAVTPGQYAVFYRDDLCLGGGVISNKSNSRDAPPVAEPADGAVTYNSIFTLEGS
jgi:tRNA-specific 2-thiouridylase